MAKLNTRMVALATAILATAIALALFTTTEEIKELGFSYLDTGIQLQRHRAILSGHAGNPWQYRVLSAYIVEAIIRFFKSFGIRHYNAYGFISFRGLLDSSIFLLSYLYYRKLGISRVNAFVGMSLLA